MVVKTPIKHQSGAKSPDRTKRRKSGSVETNAHKQTGSAEEFPPAPQVNGLSNPRPNIWQPGEGEVGIRVRMYRVGFGDFFLLTLLDPRGDSQHIVIDCGVFKGTSQTGDLNSIEAAVANMLETTNGEVALIIMTHRHADHIAGFARCADKFEKLKIAAVWMPIWESEYEPTALKFQTELTHAALGLQRHLTALATNATEKQNTVLKCNTALEYMQNATGNFDGIAALGKASNAVALDLLKRGFSGVSPKYYKAGDKPQLPDALAKIGLKCEILGPPPITDLDLMKLMDLKKNVGQYLADQADEEGVDFTPFGAEWEIDPSQKPETVNNEFYTPESFREWILGERKSWGPVQEEESRKARDRMENMLDQLQPIVALTAAKQLNSFLNNQSLVTLFEFKGKKLLFVGDAQAGNWEHWLFSSDTPDKVGTGSIDAVAREILTSLDFYKVGHHGSGNATPKLVAETMGTGKKFAAMCSTEEGVYGTEDPDDPTKGTEVPRGPLLKKLASDSALVRSDQFPITVNGTEIRARAPAPLPPSIPGCRFEVGPLWVDCYL